MKPLPIFKISCHALGEIMAGEIGLTVKQNETLEIHIKRELDFKNGVDKVKDLTDNMRAEMNSLINKRDNPELPEGAKTYCKKWLKRKLFGASDNWKAIVIEKGLQVESDAIKLISLVYQLDGLEKNEDFIGNEWAHGEPDMIFADKVRDNKSSWDLMSFPMFETDVPEKKYWYQVQCYLWILGLTEGVLDYTLIDTPMPLVLQDLKKLYFQSGGVSEDWTPERYELMYPNYRFDNVPLEMRVKSFDIPFDPELPQHIIYRVELCREYIKSLLPKDYA